MLKDLQVFKEHGSYYLKAVYEWKDDRGRYRATIPKITIPWGLSHDPDIDTRYVTSGCLYDGCTSEARISLRGQDYLTALRSDVVLDSSVIAKDVVYTVETLETKTHEMTVAEIEKKLGYKIKIVGEK